MKHFIKAAMILLLIFSANTYAYDQIFKVSEGLKIRSPYYGDQPIISIRVHGDTVSAFSKDKFGKDYNDTLFKLTEKTEALKEFFFDILEKGQFVILPNSSGALEDLRIIYKGKKYSFYEAATYLSENDSCGLDMQCPTSDAAARQGRNTTAPGTKGPLERADATKVDYMTRITF
ncbi:hypothetical protein [Marinobacter sp.]|uniref:hypothetical protein n=1 Tax=Marinobacter sp. TaxID=50741 RepID=UPI002B27AB0F|nr:hypothetical protein [Marinobacter sp.]